MIFFKCFFSNLKRKHFNKHLQSDFGLVLDWSFHKKRKWVSALSYYLVEAIIKEFNPIIISSQSDYELYKKHLKHIISMEPGWAAPYIKYDKTSEPVKAVFYSDPHKNTEKKEKYFFENNFSYVFSYYFHPFFYHFKNFPPDKFVHMPWSIPDELVATNVHLVDNSQICIFGGKKSQAYDVRNWCRSQQGITEFANSGCENKILNDVDYFNWLSHFDAIVAAGSSNPKYDLVTPKYFEIASSGSLLIGQDCKDLSLLGFNENNMIIFTKENFNEKIKNFRKNHASFISIRKEGLSLIKKSHCISHRIQTIKNLFFKIPLEDRKRRESNPANEAFASQAKHMKNTQ